MAAVWYFQPAISRNQFAADRHLVEEARKELYCGHHPDDFLDVHDLFNDNPNFTSIDDHDPYIDPAHYFPTRLTHFSLLHT